ncbi:PAS domain S-box protein [Archaeoglobus veneficus]|uniref:PAS sensor protein n=1 Tax=Archaeoglobus veneficus (strain DSM 11195 / SNP6) TaxID=693661 RepID=F2KNJ7_ARCVS|nr:PAS domain S-box protein [Archaeoglobus veneficus]AEA46225.1 PAS sensor protein [Archaeoglobus veneficus SNP6]
MSRDFKLEEILENVPVPTFVIDRNHVVRYWNRACEELTGIRKEEIIGTTNHWKAFFSKPSPLLADIVLDGVENFYRKRKVKKKKIRKVDENTYELELYLPHIGKWIYFRASLLRSNGEVIGVIETMEDITERKLMNAEIRKLSELHRIVGEAVNKSESIEQLSSMILKELKEVIDFDMGEILIYNPKTDTLEAVVQLGFEVFGDYSADVHKVNEENPSIAVRTAIEKRPIYISNVKENDLTAYAREIFRKLDIEEIYALPLVTKGKLHGVIQIITRKGKKISERDRKLLESISEHIAAGIAKIRIEEELRKSEELYRGLFESSMDTIYLTTSEGKILDMNKAAEELFGYTRDELLKMDVRELYADVSDRKKFIEKIERDGFVRNMEMRYRRKDGKIVHCLESAIAIKEGQSIIYHGIIKDITERKRMEEEIRNLSELYRLVGEAVNKSESIEELAANLIDALKRVFDFDMGEILIYDKNTNTLRAVTQIGFDEEFGERSAKVQKVRPDSKSTAVVTALRKEPLYIPDMKRSKYTEHFHDLCIGCDLQEMYSVPLISGGELQGVIQLVVKSGKRITELDRKLIDTISEHMAAGIVKIRAEERVRESEKKYRGLFESSMDAILLTDMDGRIIEVNKAAEELFGYTRDELIGQSVLRLYVNPSDRKKLLEGLSSNEFVSNFEVRYRTKRGNVIDCLESARILRDEEGRLVGYHKVIRDITERKKMENSLRRLNKLLQISSEINQLIVHEKDGRILLRRACKAFASVEDYMTVWVGIVREGKKPAVSPVAVTGKISRKLLREWLKEGLPCVEEVLTTRRAKLVEWGDEICEKCPINDEHRFLQVLVIPIVHEEKFYGILSFNSPVSDAFDTEEIGLLLDLADDLGFALKAIDVEKERSAAIKQLKENIEQFEYLADRLRNPLAIMRGYMELRDEISTEKVLEMIDSQINRIHRILDDLRRREKRTFKLKEMLNGKSR